MTEPAADRPPLSVRTGNWMFRWRNVVIPVAFVAMLLAGRPRYPGGSARADVAMDAIGVALALAGQIVRVAVIGLVYIRRGGKGGQVYADTLTQDGIFAHSRNPLYVGNILVFAGLVTILNSWPGWIFGLPAVLWTYWAIVRAEEAYLRGRFGDEYERYASRVNRFLPSLAGLGATLRAHRFDWRRVVRKEYGSTFTWTTTVLLLLVWERAANGGSEAVRPHGPVFAAIGSAILVLYLVARILKKRKLLAS